LNPNTRFREKKPHRLNWDDRKPESDAWEDEMRKNSAEIIILGEKKKKVRHGAAYKKPLQLTKNPTVGQMAALAKARGGPVIVEFQVLGKTWQIRVEPMQPRKKGSNEAK
jgi:hypothetical protein